MPRDENEPQSYGSQADWQKGDTGQEVSPLSGHPGSQNADFYESRRESETNAPDQGGLSQPEWTDHVDVLRPIQTVAEVGDSARKITGDKGGARREGFFRKRDYE
jgi:hypothetical protein